MGVAWLVLFQPPERSFGLVSLYALYSVIVDCSFPDSAIADEVAFCVALTQASGTFPMKDKPASLAPERTALARPRSHICMAKGAVDMWVTSGAVQFSADHMCHGSPYSGSFQVQFSL